MSAKSWTGRPVPEGVVLSDLDGGLAVVPGLRFAAAHVGVKGADTPPDDPGDGEPDDPGAPDVGLLDVGRPVTAAIVTTTNQVLAAPCRIGIEHVADGVVRAVIVNSGNANACTGARGLADARTSAGAVADGLGCSTADVVPMSTGVIGVPLPVERITGAVPGLVATLEDGEVAAEALARAMMTTDRIPKQRALRVEAGGASTVVAGVAKGAGMIEPAMATMLAVIVTDALLDAAGARRLLREAVERTFNRISVDSCGSTNDTVLLLATGSAGEVPERAVASGIERVCAELARAIVLDGEGVTRIARLRIAGAVDETSAHALGRSVGASALFRTALHGSDPNWGRVLAAMGASSTPFDPDRVSVAFGPVTVCRDGAAVPYDHDGAVAVLREREVDIDVDLGLGSVESVHLVADLSAGYVHINAEYTT